MAVTATITAAAIAADRQAHEARRQRGLQHRSALAQKTAQDEANRVSMIERARAEQAASRENRPTPTADIAAMQGNSTDLTGGLERDRLRLARTSRLGG